MTNEEPRKDHDHTKRCRCGCDQPVRHHFVNGHDGELMSRLLSAGRALERVTIYGQEWNPLVYAREVPPAFGDHFDHLLLGGDPPTGGPS